MPWNSLASPHIPSPRSSWPDRKWNGLRRLSCSTIWEHNMVRVLVYRMPYMLWISYQQCGPVSPIFRIHEPRNQRWKWDWPLSLLHSISTHRMFAFCLCNFGLCWSRGRISCWRNVSIRWCKNCSAGLGVEAANWPFGAPSPAELASGQGGYRTAWSWLLSDIRFLLHKKYFWSPKFSPRFLSNTFLIQ